MNLTQYFSRQFNSAKEYFEQVAVGGCFGPCQVFSIFHNETGEFIGCSGFFNEDKENRKAEIGGSWIGTSFQGSVVNVEAKLLLFSEGFENRNYVRIELKTDLLNTKSQAAMEKLGLVRDGVLRNHILLPDGRHRHSVFYSVIIEEWQTTQLKIQNRLQQKAWRR